MSKLVAAGEFHVGQVGGHTVVKRVTPVVSAAPDYAAGDTVGTLLGLDNIARKAKGSGRVTGIQVKSLVAVANPLIAHLFDADPAVGSTFTDNAAMVIAAAGKTKLLRSVALAAFAGQGAGVYWSVNAVDIAYDLAAGRKLWLALEATGAINLASASDLEVIVAAQNN